VLNIAICNRLLVRRKENLSLGGKLFTIMRKEFEQQIPF
jgi:hypothetical protein